MEDFDAHQRYFKMMKDIKKIIVPYKPHVPKKFIGEKGKDGSYVIGDTEHGICYSYGVSDNIIFENGLHDNYGTKSYCYDHTINGIKDKPDYISFKKEGLSHEKTRDCNTILNHILENGHQEYNDMLLKIDVEGCEWPVLLSEYDFKHFSQIVIEIHMPHIGYDYHRSIVNAFENLTKNHKIIHIHPVIFPIIPYVDIEFPRVFELTLLRTDLVSDEIDKDTEFPGKIDYDFEYSKFPKLSWFKDI